VRIYSAVDCVLFGFLTSYFYFSYCEIPRCNSFHNMTSYARAVSPSLMAITTAHALSWALPHFPIGATSLGDVSAYAYTSNSTFSSHLPVLMTIS
jgi:hypothetical protein